ncbi:phycobilisome protein [Chamaesiphon minutus]|uniref:Phycobilisome protein n=1 Tax=Chamaesiphon minutus (strain ATCC 27169 / PCC 6605) TaxID=1173020 RepID=K9UJL4_CHAP6|nr:phycobilisome protein [Chamaesiphon minutus]AFY95015.1 Phycobilisome protein [Chamaesiphon minutus PCC 6605]
MELSTTVRELIIKARIVSFEDWKTTHSPAIIDLFQSADDRREYLTDDELDKIEANSSSNSSLIPIARLLRDAATEIVDDARDRVLATFPAITQPGGGLYPAARAEACWRDFWHFLRCVTYGIAGGSVEYTSDMGLDYMNLLYQELQVPLDAMVLGLQELKTASLTRVEPELKPTLAPYFDRLISKLQDFKK